MNKIKQLLLIISFIFVAFFVNSYAPHSVESTLKQNGYIDIKTSRSFFDFHADWCGNNAIRINFNATKNGQQIKGYVCAYSLFTNGIHEE